MNGHKGRHGCGSKRMAVTGLPSSIHIHDGYGQARMGDFYDTNKMIFGQIPR